MLRLAAALAMLMGATALLGYLDAIGKSPWASPAERHLRAMKERGTAPTVVETLTVARMGELPTRQPMSEFSRAEQRGAVIEGYVRRIFRVPDGDIHLDLAPESNARGYAITELTLVWGRRHADWNYDRLAATLRPSYGGVTPWDQGPRRVRLTGWLLYDFPHEGRAFHHFHGNPVTPVWEIHPITRIEVWDDSLRTFVEYPG